MKITTKNLVLIAMMCAVAFAAVALCRIPIPFAPFLQYEPKDVVIVIAGFALGPSVAAAVAVISALVEYITISDTGVIGLVMNIISSVGFAVTAAIFYKEIHTFKGAIISLAVGVLVMTALMLLWNYLITPLYMEMPREKVAAMLLPMFLPFNLGKGVINSIITVLIYKPIVKALRKGQFI